MDEQEVADFIGVIVIVIVVVIVVIARFRGEKAVVDDTAEEGRIIWLLVC